MRRSTLALFLVLPCTALFTTGCGDDSSAPDGPLTEVEILARERASHHFAGDQAGRARQALAPLVEGSQARTEDLISAAAIEVRDLKYDAARGFLDRAEKLDENHPAIPYMRGRMALNDADLEGALGFFERAIELAPGDLPTKLCLGTVLYELDRIEEAILYYDEILQVGIADGGSWYVSAVFRSLSLRRELEDDEAVQRFADLWRELEAQGYKSVNQKQLDSGTFAGVAPPPVEGTKIPAPGGPPEFEEASALLADWQGGAGQVEAWDVNGDRQVDLVAWGPSGLAVALSEAGSWRTVEVTGEEVRALATFDMENDDDLDFLAVGLAGTQLFSCEGTYGAESWILSTVPTPTLTGTVREVVPVDADHDGDLDLALVGSFGARFWRSDGVGAEGGLFTDASGESGFPDGVNLNWCITEDYDADQDVDFLFAGPDGTFLMSSLRGGAFADVTEQVFGGRPVVERRPFVADVDADARPDVLVPALDGSAARLWRRTSVEAYAPVEESVAIGADAGRLFGTDLDADGSLDLVWRQPGTGVEGVLAFGLDVATPFTIAGVGDAVSLDIADLDHDCDVDLVLRSPRGIEVRGATFASPPATGLEWIGKKDNRRAVGAVCEVRVGGAYRRIYWRGKAELVGLGGRDYVDVVRVTWPNGVVQTELDIDPCYLPIDEGSPFLQSEGLVGSCPFLYTWNGTTFEFISDVLGITPLGLPIAPGMFVPPDHDEYVLVGGDQLVPDDEGNLVLQFTEELREVTYLDGIRLDVIDHPEGTRIYPNERFTFPPFPEPITHVVEDAHPPLRAMGSDGRDWAPELAELDDVHAVPFERESSQFLGLAKPHWLELEFDPAQVADATRLRLVMTGWFYWTDASVNMAAARTPGIEFSPPRILVPGAENSWVETGPPIGFPAGKTKTMVIDVTDLLLREDPRLRLPSTLRLYWDRIELAVDRGAAETRTVSLEPRSADLWSRGFSSPLVSEREDVPERFVWDELAPVARWNQHPGRYTRYGEALPLLTEVDDRYVIMGSGDALTVRFDASELPPLAEGFVRDYFVYLDGWAKDRDPNTVDALTVEPLPFHGMSGYPYGPDESFPDTPEHRAWQAEWNTREGYPRIVPLAPQAQVQWLLGPTTE